MSVVSLVEMFLGAPQTPLGDIVILTISGILSLVVIRDIVALFHTLGKLATGH